MTARNPQPFARHDLVRVAPADWDAALARSDAFAALDGGARAVVAGWAALGRPAIVRRRAENDGAGALPLGIPLPPRLGKLRVAVSVPAGTAVARVPAPPLAAALAAAPPAWAGVGQALCDLGTEAEAAPRAFGALLWAALTRLDYLGPASDLDLLWTVSAGTDLPRLLDGLRRIDALGTVPIDGEILLPDGAGVQWRELARAWDEPGGTVLAKAADGVSLRGADALFTAGGPAASP